MLGRRALAAMIDGAPFLLSAVVGASGQGPRILLLFVSCAFAAWIVAATLWQQQGRSTPGKHFMRLEVVGAGCLLCREARRLGAPMVIALVGVIVPMPAGLAFALCGAALLSYPLFMRLDPNGPWNTRTGFQVVSAS